MLAVKFGGSVITDKNRPRAYREGVVESLARFLPEDVILGHGGGSFGHYEASRGEKGPMWYARVRQAMKELNALVVRDLIKSGIPAVGIHPGDVWSELPEKVRELPGVPVVHGDVLPTMEIVSTEEVFFRLVEAGIVDRVVLVTSVEGVLDHEGRVIPVLRRGESLAEMGGNRWDVTGGMASKVSWGFKMLEKGAEEVVITGVEGFKEIMKGKRAGTRLEV